MDTSMVKKRKTCRLCDSDQIILVLPIKASPIADAFISVEKLNQHQPLFPLDLYQCQDCGHVQNIDIVDPEALFRDYLFNTGDSAGLIKHFQQYANDIVQQLGLAPGSLVVEIGSNDGTLLKFFRQLGMRVVGVDPAISIANKASAEGIPTYPEFFTINIAEQIRQEYGQADLIVANNVYAHSDELAGMTDAIQYLLNDHGVFVFEVSYLLDMVDKFLFDTVYHEHLSYHSIAPFKRFFNMHGLHFFDVHKIGTKGGSMRGFVQRINGPKEEADIIEKMISEEIRRGLNRPDIFIQYDSAINKRKADLHVLLNEAIKQNKKVVAYGASTTACTLMYHFDLTDKIAYLIDDNTKKHGLYSPGCHLEVKPASMLYTDKPDVVIVLAWQYASAICNKHQDFVSQGGVFAVPLPELKLIKQEPVRLTG